ncbi:hypothetical protein [Acetobacter vaccinii]|uniref:Hydrophobic W protein n=1 Tax=Acetobacter vaccinii TaxID=2592655 RepID=A0A5C1YN52_9PROT|nr:hypothetical protein [Acetobacter vaccinii]QEO17303.1 hypothetical protein FLP30_05805 [Acetobacter vaccinii]
MSPTAQQRITDLQVSGYLMTLHNGLFCIMQASEQQRVDASGLPGVRVALAPRTAAGAADILSFDPGGWLDGADGAALVRVCQGPVQLMVTLYQAPGGTGEMPRLRVIRLGEDTPAAPPAALAPPPLPAARVGDRVAEGAGVQVDVSAHIQCVGDVVAGAGQWVGTPGSQAWIEGFGIAPQAGLSGDDIEYQAVLGKGWQSPWVDGGEYCGSRGMALPVLGLCVRLKGQAAQAWTCRVSASFMDGTRLGPVEGGQVLEAESLAPLEAFRVEFLPVVAPTPALPPPVEGQADGQAVPPRGKKTSRRTGAARGRPRAAPALPASAAQDLALLLDDKAVAPQKTTASSKPVRRARATPPTPSASTPRARAGRGRKPAG